MTVQIKDNFLSEDYADKIKSLYSHKLVKVDSRPGFYEDLSPKNVRVPTPIENKDDILYVGDETIEEKQGIAMINNAMYLAKKEIQNYYGCGDLAASEGGLVMLTKGAENGLHSDMYNLDGSKWEDGSGREDELEYSALIYLSDYHKDFQGGTIHFPNQKLEIAPTKGMLIFFKGDLDHIHEVKKVTGGQRYAIVMFFGK